MKYLVLITVGVIGILLGSFFAKRSAFEKSGSLDKARKAVQARKEEAKQKIMDLFQEREQIRNNGVEKLLKVSDATATNYLEELEQEGKIVQEGETGRGVFYTLKNG